MPDVEFLLHNFSPSRQIIFAILSDALAPESNHVAATHRPVFVSAQQCPAESQQGASCLVYPAIFFLEEEEEETEREGEIECFYCMRLVRNGRSDGSDVDTFLARSSRRTRPASLRERKKERKKWSKPAIPPPASSADSTPRRRPRRGAEDTFPQLMEEEEAEGELPQAMEVVAATTTAAAAAAPAATAAAKARNLPLCSPLLLPPAPPSPRPAPSRRPPAASASTRSRRPTPWAGAATCSRRVFGESVSVSLSPSASSSAYSAAGVPPRRPQCRAPISAAPTRVRMLDNMVAGLVAGKTGSGCGGDVLERVARFEGNGGCTKKRTSAGENGEAGPRAPDAAEAARIFAALSRPRANSSSSWRCPCARRRAWRRKKERKTRTWTTTKKTKTKTKTTTTTTTTTTAGSRRRRRRRRGRRSSRVLGPPAGKLLDRGLPHFDSPAGDQDPAGARAALRGAALRGGRRWWRRRWRWWSVKRGKRAKRTTCPP